MWPDRADTEPLQGTANDVIVIVPQIGQPWSSQSDETAQAVAEKWNLLEGFFPPEANDPDPLLLLLPLLLLAAGVQTFLSRWAHGVSRTKWTTTPGSCPMAFRGHQHFGKEGS